MKRSSAVASVCLAVAMLSSCDTNKDVDGGVSSVTYTTNNTVAPTPLTALSGISLSDTSRYSVTWSCPSGYVVPTKLLNNLPTNNSPTAINYEGPEITGKIIWLKYDVNAKKWYIDYEASGPVYNNAHHLIANNRDDVMVFFCTQTGTQDDWI